MSYFDNPWHGQVIDIHTHVWDRSLQVPEPAAIARMMRLMRFYGVATSVFLGNGTAFLMDMQPNPKLIHDTNSYTLELMRQHPDEIIGFCYLNPANPPATIEAELTRCITEGGMKGVKLEASLNATSPLMDPMMELVEQLDVPVLHHTWYKAARMGRHESTPADLVHLARRFPHVQFIGAHMCGGRERAVHDYLHCDNIVGDTSGSQPESELVEYAVAKLGADRVVYGSDYPCRDWAAQIARVSTAAISDDAKERLLFRNAANLLGVAQPQPAVAATTAPAV